MYVECVQLREIFLYFLIETCALDECQEVISWNIAQNTSSPWFARERHLVEITQHWQKKTSVSWYSLQKQHNVYWVYSRFVAQELNGGWIPCGARLQQACAYFSLLISSKNGYQCCSSIPFAILRKKTHAHVCKKEWYTNLAL